MFKTVLQSKWFTPIIAIVIFFVLFEIVKILPAFFSVKKEISVLSEKIAETNQKASEIEKNKKIAGTDSFLEQQARIKLNYKKPDEKVVYIYKNPYNQETPNVLPNNGQKTANIWEKIVNWITGKK